MSKVTIKELVGEISSVGEDQSSYYDREKDVLVLISFDEAFSPEDEDLEVEDIEENSERFIPLPSSNWDFNPYNFMKSFIESLPPGKEQETLTRAIVGRGAFRRFKDCCSDFGLLDRWYAWQDSCIREIVLEWAGENGLSFPEE